MTPHSTALSALILSLALTPALISPGAGGPTTTSGAPVKPPASADKVGGATNGASLFYWSDVDADGFADAIAILDGTATLLHNRGDGSFEDVTASSGLGARAATWALWGDVDVDGLKDLVLGTQQGGISLWRNTDGSFFEDLTLLAGLAEVVGIESAGWVDLDSDARPDLHLTTATGHRLLRNEGSAGFVMVETGVELTRATVTPVTPAGNAGRGSTDSAGVAGGAPLTSAPGVDRGPGGNGGANPATVSGSPSISADGPLGTAEASTLCVASIQDLNGGGCLVASSVPTLGALYPLGSEFFIDPIGNVGVGTTTPAQKLHVAGSAIFDGRLGVGTSLPQDKIDAIDSSTFGTWLKLENTSTGGRRWGIGTSGSDSGGGPGNLLISDQTGFAVPMAITQTSEVGIGTINPESRLHVAGPAVPPSGAHVTIDSAAFSGTALRLRNTRPEGTDWDVYSGQAGRLFFGSTETPQAAGFTKDGNFGVGTISPSERLHVIGDAIVDGNATVDVLTILGGADIVERFVSSCGALEPGTVVAIDPDTPGALMCSADAYDTKVAGVVSGAGGVNPGICLAQDGVLDGDTPVAMSGRVYVKCSTENGAVRPGDRLTTASLAGHAMKVTDELRSVGTVLGKAMSSLDEETGLVLVLVNLQ